MSFTNETTHYSIPLPLGTDLTTPMDYNEAAQAVDTALFGAVQDSATATADAAEAKSTAQGAVEDVTALAGRVGTLEGTVATQGSAITRNANDINDTRRDLSDAIEATVEPNATATYAHAVGDLFWYNDTLYRTTSAISIGDTIVPDTNCRTTTVASELETVKTGLGAATSVTDGTVTAATGATVINPTCKVCNHTAQLYFGLTVTTTTESEVVATVSPAPAVVTYLTPNTGLTTWVTIDTSGNVSVRYPTTITTVNLYATYITQ